MKREERLPGRERDDIRKLYLPLNRKMRVARFAFHKSKSILHRVHKETLEARGSNRRLVKVSATTRCYKYSSRARAHVCAHDVYARRRAVTRGIGRRIV